MNKASRVILCLTLWGSTLAAWALPLENGKQVVPGRVVMTDGETFQFPTLYLPDYTDAAVLASDSVGYHDSFMLFNADDLLYIEFWHPDTPERIHRLYSVRLKKQPRNISHFWAKMDMQTPYGFLVMAYPRYILQEDGTLQSITLYGNRTFNYPRIFALHYGHDYYDTWPLDYESPILAYLNRDGDIGPGISMFDADALFDNGFSPDDFFDISDTDFGW